MKLKHCWHPFGAGTRDTYRGGSQEHVCCHCNLSMPIMFRFEHRQIEGHGPHATGRKTVWEWPNLECPERTEAKEGADGGA